jgi:hypothetical protein
MNPLPVGNAGMPSTGGRPLLPLPSALPLGTGQAKRPATPRQTGGSDVPPFRRAYPALLIASTCLAGVFCYLYLTKPVIVQAAADTPPPPAAVSTPPARQTSDKPAPIRTQPATAMLPAADHLPGDSKAPAAGAPAAPARLPIPALEETNLRVQHVLSAESPGGDLSRLVVDVPVLYRTGNLAWTETQVAESRQLLKDLTTYQEKSRDLRAEGNRLLAAWNRLIAASIPTPVLRADSPALPENQNQDGQSPASPGIDTTRSIKLHPSGS